MYFLEGNVHVHFVKVKIKSIMIKYGIKKILNTVRAKKQKLCKEKEKTNINNNKINNKTKQHTMADEASCINNSIVLRSCTPLSNL